MNIKFKRFLRMALCLLLCAVFFTGGVFAAGKLQKRTITVYSGVDIYVDDARLDARDANGNPVEVFIYNGTTYLPVRAVGEAVGKAVQWEAKTSSVYIGQHKSDKPAVWLGTGLLRFELQPTEKRGKYERQSWEYIRTCTPHWSLERL